MSETVYRPFAYNRILTNILNKIMIIFSGLFLFARLNYFDCQWVLCIKVMNSTIIIKYLNMQLYQNQKYWKN